jgi:hypothetical protein
MTRQSNPYEILKIGTKASISEVVQRSRELIKETADKDLQRMYRRAAEEIRQHPVQRAICQFWEPPETNYQDDALDRFCQEHRRQPFKGKWLRDKRDAFINETCCSLHLALLALPEIYLPETYSQCRLQTIPQEELTFPLKPQEILDS